MNERIELPEPAAEHWTDACELLHQVWGRTATRMWIGGGTILATRWAHRKSTDLDFKLSKGTALRQYATGTTKGRRLDRTMATRGYRRKTQRASQIVFEHEATGMRIDLFEQDPTPRTGRARIEAPKWGTVEVLDNEEILTGKVHGRLHRAPARDLLDFAVAAREEPEVWERAVNTAVDGVAKAAIEEWSKTREEHRRKAEEDLIGVTPRYRMLAHECWAHATAAIVQATWDGIYVRYTSDGAVVEGHKEAQVRQRDEAVGSGEELYGRLLQLGTDMGEGMRIVPYLEKLIRQGIERGLEDRTGVMEKVKTSMVGLDLEDPVMAQAVRMLDRDCRGHAPGHDFARELATEDWPRYEFVHGEEGFVLKVALTKDSPQQTEGEGLTLEGMVRLECEMRRWPPEAEDAIRAETVREMQRGKEPGRG